MIRPLRSTPITGASTLLRVGRPLGTALVFGLVGSPLVPFPLTLQQDSPGVTFLSKAPSISAQLLTFRK